MERVKLISIVILFAASNAFGLGLTRYVDNASPGGNDGLTEATAWDSLTQITGVGAGDTVYVSGGSTSKVYLMGFWSPPSGTAGNPFTLAINPNAGHNGIAIFRSNHTNSYWFGSASGACDYVTINGRLNGTNHFRMEQWGLTTFFLSDTGNFTIGLKILGLTISGNGCLKLYDTRQCEVGWIEFELFARFPPQDCQLILGVGRGDETGFGNNSIHDCIFNYYYMYGVDPRAFNLGNNGNDCIDHCGSTDFYNNRFIGTYVGAGNFAGGDHQDVIMTDGRYMRFWNNYFENSGQYFIFGGFFGSGNSDWQIFNNVFNWTDPQLYTQQQAVSIAIGSHITATYTRFWIWNNTIKNGSQGISLGTPADGDTGSNNIVQNNIIYNTSNQIVSGTTVSNNTSGTSGVNFVGTTNLRLLSNSTAAINQGITLSSLNATSANDADGNARSVPWDIGAYEFGSIVGPGIIQLTASSYSVGEAGGTVTITATRVAGSAGAIGVSYATSNGTAVSGSDYTSASGTLSWGDGVTTNQTFNVTITNDGDVEGNQDFTVTLSSPTGGATLGSPTSAPVTIIDDEEPTIPLMGGLTFGAEEGLIESPFVTASGAISQPTEVSDPALGGRARYRVTIPSTGDYRMEVNVDAATTGSNSFYLEWDGEPTEPADISDVVSLTTGVQTRNVCGRGTGAFDNPQFNPRVWTLTAGVHTLYVRGREASTELDSFSVISLGAPPDTTAPVPDPMTWEVAPFAPGLGILNTLLMTATLATDDTGPVEYFFDETSGNPGGTDSGWQESRDYSDDGLMPATTYTYRVKARDAVGTPNETAYSTSESAVSSQAERSGVSKKGRGTSGRAITW